MSALTTFKSQDLILKKFISGYQYIDEGKGKPIVLLHGLFGSLSNWENVIYHFRKSYRVIVPILPIYDPSFKDTSLDSVVKYLHDFFVKLHLEEVYLMGNSLGGQIALKFALQYPDLLNRLVITGSAGLYENTMGTTFPRRGDYTYIKEKVRGIFYNPEVASEKLVEEVYHIIRSIPKSLRIVRFARVSQKNNLAAELPDIRIPTLILWGRNDTVTPVEVSYRFYNLIPNSRLRILEECGHVPMMEQPAQFNTIVKEFLGQAAEMHTAEEDELMDDSF
jgi:pimeloyl-ACP methyl ester carboxylesterase